MKHLGTPQVCVAPGDIMIMSSSASILSSRIDRITILLFSCTLLLSACSDSGSNSADPAPAAFESDTVITDSELGDSDIPNDVVIEPANTTTNVTDNQTSDVVIEPANTTTSVTDNQATNGPVNIVIADPLSEPSQPSALTSTQVTFDITVPAYVSDSLQVRLLWGEKDITAAWVVDETWTISDEFPLNTENPLTVTFSDNNGAISLGWCQ